MQCKKCKYLIRKDKISPMSQIMGYSAECAKCGVLFNLERSGKEPIWCPLREDQRIEEKP